MGIQTLAEFRDDITLKFGNRADVALTDARLNRWVNTAYRKLASALVEKKLKELRKEYVITLVQDQGTYDISQSVIGFQDLGTYSVTFYDTTGAITTVGTRKHILQPRSQRVNDRRTSHNAQPRYYSTESGTTNEIVIWPIPGATEAGRQIEYKYWAQPSNLALDTDTTILPEEYDDALSFGAIAVSMSKLPGYDAEALAMLRVFQTWANSGSDPLKISADDWGHRSEVRTREYQESRFNQQ